MPDWAAQRISLGSAVAVCHHGSEDKSVIPVASDEFLELVATKFRMLADPTRLAILRSLMKHGEMNVSEIVAASGRSTANVSKHLKHLSEARMLIRRKEGSFVLYRLDDPVLKKICELVCESLRRELESEVRRNNQLLKRRT
jgi:DNA-binding transcriptional ArsR family regulator